MSYNTIIEQGSFVAPATIVNRTIPCRIDPDWVEVFNYTQYGTSTQYAGVKYYWQKGMANFTALAEYHAAATSVTNSYLMTTGGIAIIDTSSQIPATAQALVTTFVDQSSPALCHATAHGYVAGDIVRIYGTTAMLQIASMDFTVGTVAANTFQLAYVNSSGFAAAATAGSVEKINDMLFYPRMRYITAFAAVAGSTTDIRITMSVTHAFTVGQKISIRMPVAFGPSQFDSQYGTIVAINTADASGYTNTIDVRFASNTIGTAFAFPLSGSTPFSFAQVIPVGEDMAVAVSSSANILGDAEENQAAINIVLGTGMGATTILGPAGSVAADILYWKAGRSFSNN